MFSLPGNVECEAEASARLRDGIYARATAGRTIKQYRSSLVHLICCETPLDSNVQICRP